MNKKTKFSILAVFLLTIAISSTLTYAVATTTTPKFSLYSGIYPGAPLYTVYDAGSTYQAKNQYGVNAYSGTPTQIVNNIMSDNEGGTILLQASYDNPMQITGIDTLPNSNGWTIIGQGEVDWTTSSNGSAVFGVGIQSRIENIFFHEGNTFYHCQFASAGQTRLIDRFYNEFPSNGGNFTTPPELIVDGTINTEGAGSIIASGLRVFRNGATSATPYEISLIPSAVTNASRFAITHVGNDKDLFAAFIVSIPAGNTSVTVEHGLDIESQLIADRTVVSLSSNALGSGNLAYTSLTPTEITVSCENAPSGGDGAWYISVVMWV